jgi:hypothetical protein
MLQALSNAEQLTATPATHCEFCTSQVSTPLHGLPSLHCWLVVHGHFERSLLQPPSWSLQVSTLQATPSSQEGAGPAHFPPVQVSTVLHTELSLQGEPSGFGGVVQVPVAGSQLPAAWQSSSATHVTCVLDVQTPA